MSFKADGNEVTYAYNGDGQRVSKTYNGTTTEYFYNGEILAGQKTGDDVIVFMYDNNGDAFGFIYNETEYYYVKNAQNDIIAIADADGTVIANYYYDAWGKPEGITGNTEIANLNPLRYRSYYYDSDTGLYYISSRYYAPEICRFINVDDIDYLGTDASPLSYNLFAYCMNNTVNRFDVNGNFSVPNWLKVTVGAVAIAGLAVATVCTGGAASAGLNIVTGSTTVVGKAHGSILHKLATNMEAGKMAASGHYSRIGINKSLKKMGLNGGLTRPDVIGIAKNRANKLVEVVSPRQSTNYIARKMSNMLSNNPGTVGKIVNWVRRLFK